VKGLYSNKTIPTVGLEFCTKEMNLSDGSHVRIQLFDTGKLKLKIIFNL
jgi:hypothetical protein